MNFLNVFLHPVFKERNPEERMRRLSQVLPLQASAGSLSCRSSALILQLVTWDVSQA